MSGFKLHLAVWQTLKDEIDKFVGEFGTLLFNTGAPCYVFGDYNTHSKHGQLTIEVLTLSVM